MVFRVRTTDRVHPWLKNLRFCPPAKCVFIVKTLPFSPIREIFPRLFRPTPFSPNVYAGFLKSVFLILPNFQFSTSLFPNNHGPPTRVRCERVLFFPHPCHTQLKTNEPPPTNATHLRAPPLMWSAPTCLRFELGDMSPSPPSGGMTPPCPNPPPTNPRFWTAVASAARHRFRQPSNPANPIPSLDVGRGGRRKDRWMLDVFFQVSFRPCCPFPSFAQ